VGNVVSGLISDFREVSTNVPAASPVRDRSQHPTIDFVAAAVIRGKLMTRAADGLAAPGVRAEVVELTGDVNLLPTAPLGSHS
jgi:hypothetical protein